MSGMITTGTSVSSYGNRTIAIEVTGVCRQDVMRMSNYTVKVPYSRMSQTIQGINRMGGKIAGISLGNPSTADVPTPSAPIESQTQEQPKKRGRRKNRNNQ